MNYGTLPSKGESRRKTGESILHFPRRCAFVRKLLMALWLLGGSLVAITGAESSPEWVWAESIDGDWTDYASAVASDAEGNVYVTGSHQMFGSHPGHSFGYVTMFLRKYDSQH